MKNKLMTFKKYSLMKRILLLMFFSFIAASHSFAQSAKSNLGTDFYVAFGKNNQEGDIAATGNLNVELVLRIATLEATQVTLSFTTGSVPDRVFKLPADTIFDYILTRPEAIATYTGTAQSNPAGAGANKKSVRVTATKPIKLVAVNSANHSYEATLVWPTDSWGTEYYNIGVAPYSTGSHCNGYIVIAKENNTTVSGITGISGFGNLAINGPITLNAGEVYSYYNTGQNANKLGEHIVSDKPIAFFNSITQAQITTTGYYLYNYVFEQLAPVNQWGKEFILPTNKYKAGLFRIYTKDASTVLKYTFTDGTQKDTTITVPGVYEIRIDGNTNAAAKACYLTSSSPVGVCAFQIANRTQQSPPQIGQPASAWLPPVQQMTRNVLMSPLDLAGQYAYLAMNHYLTVIVRSSSKNSTTIALNGKASQPAGSVPNFNWIADNIGGSDYSFGIFKIDSTFIQNGYKAKNKTVLVDNPDGLIALAFSSEGSYATYFYTVGLNYRDLSAGFTINDVDYIDLDGKGVCDASNFTFEAYPDALTNVVWNINGALAGTGKQLIKDDLPDGLVVVEMIANNKTYTCSFFVGGLPVVWTPYTTAGNERYNWNNLANWTPAVVPNSCNNVFIPGNLDYYPNLSNNADCNKIYFMPGAELGRPDLLTYKKAYVQYNFGLKQEPQKTGNDDMELVLQSASTSDRMEYSAAVSAAPMEREHWYMLSSPLKNVVTGDLGFGGFPLTFLKKFGPVTKDAEYYPVGNWTTSYNKMAEPVTSNATDGFAFYMYGYLQGGDAVRNRGCEESGVFGRLNELKYLPAVRSEKEYGIKGINGILELPFFADSTNLYAHRTQVYDGQKSTFYYINNGGTNPADFGKFTGTTESVSRDESNYRFAPENYDKGSWVFPKQIYHSAIGLIDGEDFLVGNPYMSSINMLEFYNDNSSSIEPEFKIWNGITFNSYSMDTKTGGIVSIASDNSSYVPPLQGFFLTYKEGGEDILFDVENISTVRPVKSSPSLRSDRETKEENILRIKAENRYAASNALVGYKQDASAGFVRGEDVRKLFTPHSYVPEIYSLAGEMPVDINFIGNGREIIIPLGIKTGQTGEIKLTFTGMDNYFQATKIELIDAKENKTVDLTGKSSYTCSFNHTEKGIQNGRFSLRISNAITSLPDINPLDDIIVHGDSKGIYVITSSSDPVKQVAVYDFHGRKLYESTSGAKYYPLQGISGQLPLIVKVSTGNNVKTVKINY